MAKPPSLSRKSPELKHAAAWQTFYRGPGRPALAALFAEFGLYGTPSPGENSERAWGQRDVLVRIVRLIGLKEEEAPADASEDVDILDRIIGTHGRR